MATNEFTREHLKKCVSKICLTIGWHTSMTTPIDILTDILTNYLTQLGKTTVDYATGFGMTEPNVDHLALAFRDYHVNLSELEEYVKNVDFVEPPVSVPRYPIAKEDHLNFLKPGSKEVVTRPVHIHEHLPPMHPVVEAIESESEVTVKVEESNTTESTPVFKRPAELSPGENFKRPRLLLEDEGRPTREISSVMMTTSGFLSPAREGKLPESRSPITPIDPLPPPLPPPAIPSLPPSDLPNKKPTKIIRKVDKKRDKIGRELFKPTPNSVKKSTGPKDGAKTKKALGAAWNAQLGIKPGSQNDPKFNKALAAARLKTEKLNTTITPIPTKVPPPPLPVKVEPHVDKVIAEPDKRKINILKKISVKNENKVVKVKDEIIKQESRESSPDLIIDESMGELASKVHHLSSDITIELVNNANGVPLTKSPEKAERPYFDDDSPPGTPSTPKTPEMISQSPPLVKGEKRKRKDKSKIRKTQKTISPNRLDSGSDLDCPKTPEAHVATKQEKLEIPAVPPSLPFPFFNHFAGPGLIPPISNPLFQHLPLPPLGMPSFGQPPYMPPVHPGMPLSFIPPIKHEEPIEKPPQPERIPPPPHLDELPIKLEKKSKEHKKDKKDKIKKKNKKDKIKNKAEKKKLKEEKKDKIKKEKREKKKEMLKEGESHLKLTLKLGNGSLNQEQPKLIYKVDEMSPAREQTTKLTFKLSSAPPSEPTDLKKLNIKPIVKKEEEPAQVEVKREMSPELAKISALVTGQPKPKSNPPVTMSNKDELIKEEVVHIAPPPRTGPGPGRPRIHPIKTKPTKLIKPQQTMVKDSEGNKVWICPGCGKQDDGSPMIGCDDCDAWYHWICVGIQVEPDDSEDWYCRLCISKKQEVLQTEKKKKRKKREKKQQFN